MNRSNAIRGVIAPNLTPFEDDLSVATDLYCAHALALLEGGCAGLAPFGTTGEATSVGIEERISAIAALIAAGADPRRLIPGTGLPSLTDTARLSRACLDMGCRGVMTLPPFYYKGVTEDGLFAYFAALVEAIGRPGAGIYLYHIPQVAGVGLPPALVARLKAAFPGEIAGIKDSSGDWANTAALCEIADLTVYPGAETPLIEALAAGASGCVSATANLNAAPVAEAIRRWDAGDREGAEAVFAPARAFRLKMQERPFIPCQKRLIAMRTGEPRWARVRPPLEAMSAAEGAAFLAELEGATQFRLRAGAAAPA